MNDESFQNSPHKDKSNQKPRIMHADTFNEEYVNSFTRLVKDDDENAQKIALMASQEREQKIAEMTSKAQMEIEMEVVNKE